MRQQEQRKRRLNFRRSGVRARFGRRPDRLAVAAAAYGARDRCDHRNSRDRRGKQRRKTRAATPATIAAPPPAPAPAAPATISSEEIAAAKNDLGLDPAQRKTIEDFAAQHAGDRVKQDVTVAVGAEVPAQVELRDMPLSLVDALSAYSSDQYFLAPKHFVIVSKLTRRVVAVIPLGA